MINKRLVRKRVSEVVDTQLKALDCREIVPYVYRIADGVRPEFEIAGRWLPGGVKLCPRCRRRAMEVTRDMTGGPVTLGNMGKDLVMRGESCVAIFALF